MSLAQEAVQGQPEPDTPGAARTTRTQKPAYARVFDVVCGRDAPYSKQARAVALALAYHLNTDDNGRCSAWPSVQTLAASSGWSESAVQRALAELCDGDSQVFQREFPPVRRQAWLVARRKQKPLYSKNCRYTFIENLAAFRRGRDKARAACVVDFAQRAEAARVDAVRLQVERADFGAGGTLGVDEYHARVAQLEREAQGRLPARVVAGLKPAKCFTAAQLTRLAAYQFGSLMPKTEREEQACAREWFAFLTHAGGRRGKPCARCLAGFGAAAQAHAPAYRAWVCGCGKAVFVDAADAYPLNFLPAPVGEQEFDSRHQFRGVHEQHGRAKPCSHAAGEYRDRLAQLGRASSGPGFQRLVNPDAVAGLTRLFGPTTSLPSA